MEPNTCGDLLQAISSHFINWEKWETAEETKKSLLEILNTVGARTETSDDLISRVSVWPSPHCLWCLAARQGHTQEHLSQNPSSWTLLKAYWILGQRAQKSVFLVHAPNLYLHITICPSYSVVPCIWCYGSLSDSFKRITLSPSRFQGNKHTKSSTLYAAAHAAVAWVRIQAGQLRGNFESSLRGVVITLMFVILGFSCAKSDSI